jgi:hypothetical protein
MWGVDIEIPNCMGGSRFRFDAKSVEDVFGVAEDLPETLAPTRLQGQLRTD